MSTQPGRTIQVDAPIVGSGPVGNAAGRVGEGAAHHVLAADFDGDGRLDFATTGCCTPGYFPCDRPQVLVSCDRSRRPVPGQPAIPGGPPGG
jgi:hypothetical protein